MATPSMLDEWLKTVPDVMCFTEKLKLYVPTCDDACLPAARRLNDEVVRIFKGSTVYREATGCWIRPDGKTECEPVQVIEVGHQCSNKKTLASLVKAIADYSSEAGQHSVSVHNGSFFIARSDELLNKYKEFAATLPG